jgi:hypothetical protein
MQAEGGAAGFVDIVARLLSATFAGPAAPIVGAIAGEIVKGIAGAGGDTPTAGPSSRRPTAKPEAIRDLAPAEGRVPPIPFPGTR